MKISINQHVNLLKVFYLLYACWFIYQTSVVINGVRYFSLFDDAMISMAYANNFLHGYGLNWAKFGAPVEGFTNPLWTFIMIPVNTIPIAPAYKSLVMQLICLFINLGILSNLSKLFDRITGNPTSLWKLFLLYLTAFYYPLNFWSLVGMETGLQALMIIVMVRQTLELATAQKENKEKKILNKKWVILCLWFAAAIFLRYDMVLLPFFCIIYLFGYLKKNRATAFIGFSIMILPSVIYFIFRILYFNDWLPNTWYLKMTGVDTSVRIWRGWIVFLKDFKSLTLWIVVAFIFIILSRKKAIYLVFLPVLSYWAYSVYVGGDAWEDSDVGANRFTTMVMPLFFLLLILGLREIGKLLASFVKWKTVHLLAGLLLFFILFTGFNKLKRFQFEHPSWSRVLMLYPPMHMGFQKIKIDNTLLLNSVAKKTDVVAVVWAGIPAYFGHFRTVDILGFNDRFIAHGPTAYPITKPGEIQPGHLKWNNDYIFRELKPDFVMELWWIEQKEFEQKYGYDLCMIDLDKREYYWKKKN